MAEVQLILSDDGSHTLFVPGLNEHYHSHHGALNESEHVYIKSGFRQIDKPCVNILEIGFGTGLNALLTYSVGSDKMVRYCACEILPLPRTVWSKLNYQQLVCGANGGFFDSMHEAEWEHWVELSEQFSLKKMQGDFRTMPIEGPFDLVYFDAFAPDKQPDLWSVEVFEKIFRAMAGGGVFVTYCAKGTVRRALIQVGFKVERLPGPPAKRHILRAIKIE